MAYHYFVSFQGAPRPGVLMFGNCEVAMRLPVTSMDDVRELARTVARGSSEIGQPPTILNFQLLRES